MFGEEDFKGIPLNSLYTIDHLLNFQITRSVMAYRWKVGSIAAIQFVHLYVLHTHSGELTNNML